MVALKYVMSGDCQESHHGKSRVGNILHKNHGVFFLVSFRHQLFSGAWILDPFTGSSTTGIAANLLGRRFLGIDQNEEFLELSLTRREEINDVSKRTSYLDKLQKQAQLFEDNGIQVLNEPFVEYGQNLPF